MAIKTALNVSADPSHAEESNYDILNKFLRSRTEMNLLMENEELARFNGRHTDIINHAGKEPRKWKRIISFVDVSGLII